MAVYDTRVRGSCRVQPKKVSAMREKYSSLRSGEGDVIRVVRFKQTDVQRHAHIQSAITQTASDRSVNAFIKMKADHREHPYRPASKRDSMAWPPSTSRRIVCRPQSPPGFADDGQSSRPVQHGPRQGKVGASALRFPPATGPGNHATGQCRARECDAPQIRAWPPQVPGVISICAYAEVLMSSLPSYFADRREPTSSSSGGVRVAVRFSIAPPTAAFIKSPTCRSSGVGARARASRGRRKRWLSVGATQELPVAIPRKCPESLSIRQNNR